jgi:hypothetical protein
MAGMSTEVMASRAYPFYRIEYQKGRKTPPWRIYLPVRFSNPSTGQTVSVYGLVDTGADASLLPASLVTLLGHDLKGQGVKDRITKGIEAKDMTVYRHTFDVELLSATGGATVRIFRGSLIDCSDSNPPVILGASDFLTHFKWAIDYQTQDVVLDW